MADILIKYWRFEDATKCRKQTGGGFSARFSAGFSAFSR